MLFVLLALVAFIPASARREISDEEDDELLSELEDDGERQEPSSDMGREEEGEEGLGEDEEGEGAPSEELFRKQVSAKCWKLTQQADELLFKRKYKKALQMFK
jgi:hypothetical protein